MTLVSGNAGTCALGIYPLFLAAARLHHGLFIRLGATFLLGLTRPNLPLYRRPARRGCKEATLAILKRVSKTRPCQNSAHLYQHIPNGKILLLIPYGSARVCPRQASCLALCLFLITTHINVMNHEFY